MPVRETQGPLVVEQDFLRLAVAETAILPMREQNDCLGIAAQTQVRAVGEGVVRRRFTRRVAWLEFHTPSLRFRRYGTVTTTVTNASHAIFTLSSRSLSFRINVLQLPAGRTALTLLSRERINFP